MCLDDNSLSSTVLILIVPLIIAIIVVTTVTTVIIAIITTITVVTIVMFTEGIVLIAKVVVIVVKDVVVVVIVRVTCLESIIVIAKVVVTTEDVMVTTPIIVVIRKDILATTIVVIVTTKEVLVVILVITVASEMVVFVCLADEVWALPGAFSLHLMFHYLFDNFAILFGQPHHLLASIPGLSRNSSLYWQTFLSLLVFLVTEYLFISLLDQRFYVDKLQATFRRWEQLFPSSGERAHLTKELVAGCESIEWQVDELDRAIAVAARDPVRFSIDEVELEKRKRWTGSTRNQMGTLRKALQMGLDKSLGQNHSAKISQNGMRRELLRLPDDRAGTKPNRAMTQENDELITSETDRQVLLMNFSPILFKPMYLLTMDWHLALICLLYHDALINVFKLLYLLSREQDEELDELSASVERLGGVGLTIHEELMGQERILEELDQDMDKTSNRLEFVQVSHNDSTGKTRMFFPSPHIFFNNSKGKGNKEPTWSDDKSERIVYYRCNLYVWMCNVQSEVKIEYT
eukprot:Gb_30438 [translate_table: standard]